jgi:hypothetical protein
VLFERRLREGIHSGAIVLAFRRWRRPQVVAGHRYRTGLDIVVAEAVDVIRPADIQPAEAGQAGFASPAELLAGLRGGPELPLYRIRFRRLDGPDPREQLAKAADLGADQVEDLCRRLDRMDRLSPRGPWTQAVLSWIGEHPATTSAVLAEGLDWPRQDLKTHIRRLKNLGLTASLPVGYQLTPRGAAFLRTRAPAAAGGPPAAVPEAGPAWTPAGLRT